MPFSLPDHNAHVLNHLTFDLDCIRIITIQLMYEKVNYNF